MSLFRQSVELLRERLPSLFGFLRATYMRVFWIFDNQIVRYRKAGSSARFRTSMLKKTEKVRALIPIDARLLEALGGVLTLALTLFYFFQSKESRYRAAADFVHEQSGLGASPVLLFGDRITHIQDLAQIIAKLTERSQYADSVAFVVPNGDVEAAIRPLAGSAAFVNVQQFWLDQTVDVANHELIKRLRTINWNARRRIEADRVKAESPFDLFEARYMDLHVELVTMLRLAHALRAAFDAGKTTVVVCQPMLVEQHSFYQDFLKPDMRGEIITLAIADASHPDLLYRVEPKAKVSQMISLARGRVGTLHGTDLEKESEQVADCDSRGVAIVADASPETHSWPTVMNLALAAKRSQRPLRILVENPAAARALRSAGFTVDDFFLVDPNSNEPGFAKAFVALLDQLELVLSGSEIAADTVLASLQGYVVERLVQDNMSYRPLVHNYRVHGQIRRWLVEARVGSLAVIPHWGNLGWAAAAAANALNIPVGSTPSVSVAGNSASIVGWNRMDVIGCYGLQCQDAFASQGYFPDRLRLTGSVALDEVLHVSREQARGRLKAFGRMAAAGRRIVLYATSGANKNEREILTRIVEFCGEPSSEASLVVRPHQAIGSAFYEEAVAAAVGQRRQEFATVISEGTAHENILAADIVITDFSTVGAEAVLIGRPLLTINTTGTPFPANNYADLGVAAGAHTLDEIGPALRRLAEEGAFWRNARESLEAFIKAYNWGGDGQASTRFLAELERLAQRAEAPALQPVGALPLPSKRD